MFYIYVLCVCFGGIEFSYRYKERHLMIRICYAYIFIGIKICFMQ